MEIQVIDQDMGDEIRALNSLSGGETFLVSLALGLSSLSASDTPIDSLFIDEGLGTLDSETLETALSVLDELQAQGRQVGILSHVEGLATRHKQTCGYRFLHLNVMHVITIGSIDLWTHESIVG